MALPEGTELISSELALLEITRALLRGGADHTRVPFYVGQAPPSTLLPGGQARTTRCDPPGHRGERPRIPGQRAFLGPPPGSGAPARHKVPR